MDCSNCTNDDEGTESQSARKLWASLHVMFRDRDVKAHKEMVCMRVLDYFERDFRIAAEPRVACIIDDNDCKRSEWHLGAGVQGFHVPKEMASEYFRVYKREIIAPIDERTYKFNCPYARVVYLFGSTSETDIGITLTFAHELQHFLQYTKDKPLWVKNTLLMSLHNDEFKVRWNYPVEIEARATAKKVAECLFGAEPVREYIQERIKAHITDNDVRDWEFVQRIVSSEHYNLAEGTKPLVHRHRRQLEEFLQRCKNDVQTLKCSGLQIEDLADVDFDALA